MLIRNLLSRINDIKDKDAVGASGELKTAVFTFNRGNETLLRKVSKKLLEIFFGDLKSFVHFSRGMEIC